MRGPVYGEDDQREMFFALCRFEIHIREGRSLKAKRSVINRLKERLRSRYRAAVAEVGSQELWQRGTLGVALVGSRPSALADGLAAMRRLVEQEPRCEIIAWDTRIESFADAPRAVADPPAAASAWYEEEEGDEFYGPRVRPEAPEPDADRG